MSGKVDIFIASLDHPLDYCEDAGKGDEVKDEDLEVELGLRAIMVIPKRPGTD